MSIYATAFEFLQESGKTETTTALAELVLRLYKASYAFSIGSILYRLKSAPKPRQMALDLITEYAAYGESYALRAAGRYVEAHFPELVISDHS